jgi:hypothetical protein
MGELDLNAEHWDLVSDEQKMTELADLQQYLDYAREYVQLVNDFAESKNLTVKQLLGEF